MAASGLRPSGGELFQQFAELIRFGKDFYRFRHFFVVQDFIGHHPFGIIISLPKLFGENRRNLLFAKVHVPVDGVGEIFF